jgi:P pilus assembly chaperone PapD
MKSFFTLVVALCLLLQAQSAQASFNISKMNETLELAAGSKITKTLSVSNSSNEPIYISSSVMDWSMGQDGKSQFKPANSLPDSCASWIQLNPANFVVGPKQSVQVRYSIDVPTNHDKESRAIIFFKSRPVPTKAKTGSMVLNISLRMGCKIRIRPKQAVPSVPKAEIVDIEALNKSDKVRVLVKNSGIVSLGAKGTIEALDKEGRVVSKGKLAPENVVVFPELTREMRAVWPEPLPKGEYLFKVAIDYGAPQLIGGQLKALVEEPTVTEVKPQQ